MMEGRGRCCDDKRWREGGESVSLGQTKVTGVLSVTQGRDLRPREALLIDE